MKINPQDYIGKAIFITATNTNVGKTFASEVFLKYFAKNGLKVGYFKPIETGVIANFLKLTINDIVPYQFTLPASPYVAKGNTFLDIDFLIEKKEYLQTFCDVLIIEGAGGLFVPIKKDFFMIDFIKELRVKTFLITSSKLGCINDTLLSIEALKNKQIDFDFFINLYEDKDSFEEVSKPFLKDYFKELKFLQDYKI